WLLGAAHLVGAVVVEEGHGHPPFGAVDADLAGEAGVLLHRRALPVVADHIADVLRAVAVRLVGEDLLDTGLGGVDVELGGDEEARLLQAQHQHGDHDQPEHPAEHAEQHLRLRTRALRTRCVIRRELTVLAGLLTELTRLLTIGQRAELHWPLAALAELPRPAGLPVGGRVVLGGLRRRLRRRSGLLVRRIRLLTVGGRLPLLLPLVSGLRLLGSGSRWLPRVLPRRGRITRRLVLSRRRLTRPRLRGIRSLRSAHRVSLVG